MATAYIERVIILATLPTQCVSEMTWPTTEARSLTLMIAFDEVERKPNFVA